MTTVLITGGAGFIGSRLATHFGAQGWRVVLDEGARSDAVRGPLTVPTLVRAMDGVAPDVILHAAGSGAVGQVAADPVRHLPADLASMLAVLEYARTVAPRARVVLLSSAAVYGSAPAQPQAEADARRPVSLYGLSKEQSEELLAHYADQFGLQTTAVRLFSVYGPGLRKQLLWDAMNKFAKGSSEFFGTGQEFRDWVHIDDVCGFMSCLLARPALAAFDVFNCGGHAASTQAVLGHLASQANAEPPKFNGQTRAGDPACLLADCSKAARALGWRAQIGWRAGVAAYAQWFTAQSCVPSRLDAFPAVPDHGAPGAQP